MEDLTYSAEWFEKAANQGHVAAEEKLIAINEAKEANKRRIEENREEIERTYLKCPLCGRPIHQVDVGKYWGWRYYYYYPEGECKWADNKFSEPYRP